MIKCLVVDDKPLAIDVIVYYISRVPFLELAFSTTNPLEALHKVMEGDVDLVFLDIQMPELSGLQFMKIIKGKCQVILTTAYSEYAFEGFENDAVDYLLKPVSFERFYKAVEKSQVIKSGTLEIDRVPSLSPSMDIKEKKQIFVRTEYKTVRIDIADILYVEGMQNYVIVNTHSEKVTSLQTMIKMEEQLPRDQFTRVSKSFIVAVNKIISIERNQVYIADKIITIGEVYRENFYRVIENN